MVRSHAKLRRVKLFDTVRYFMGVPTEPTCTLPTIDFGSFFCKTASGLFTEKPGDGDVCELTCDAGLYLVDTINPVVTCRVLGTEAKFDKTPSCSKCVMLVNI